MTTQRRRRALHGGALIAAFIAACAPVAIASERSEASALGSVIEDFELRDYYGQPRRLADFGDRPMVVVAFLGIDCPLVKHYARRLGELANEYEPLGVQFIGINSNRQDSIGSLASFARQYQLSFPILKDPDQAIADRFGATRTPEVFVLDRQRIVRYRGRVDDQYGVGFGRPKALRRDLAEAMAELLEGHEVSVPRTEVAGCLIGRSPRIEPHGEVTYSRQISRILARHCVECHRPGEVGPFPLTSFDEVAPWAPMIREVLDQGRMPPWFADPRYGKFSNDSRLSDEDRALVFKWVANGAPEGDRAELSPPPKFIDGWRMEQPDVVLAMREEPITIPATGRMDYQVFMIDPGFSDDVWVQAAEARPGNRAVVHHHVAYFVPPGADARISQVTNQIAGYAPGTPPFAYAPGTALRIPGGSKIVFQMHYTPIGVEQQDLSYLGLKFADPRTVVREVHNEIAGNLGIRIPAGEADYRLTAERRFRRDTLLLNLAPHMHLRGKAFRFEIERPDGTREVLLDVPRYDFNWQLRYDLAEPLLVRAGSRLHCFARFDNSADNPNNPDATVEVRFGEQSWEEMMFGVYQTVDPPENASAKGPFSSEAGGN